MLKFETLHNTDFRIPHEVLQGLNKVFQITDHTSLFITMWYMVYARTSRALTYAGAGHPPLIMFNNKGKPEKVFSQNVLIGIDDQYEFLSDTREVSDLTSIYLFTDGTYEVFLPDGSMMKIDHLMDFLAQYRNQPDNEIELLYDYMVEMNAGNSLDDDFTIMRVSFNQSTNL